MADRADDNGFVEVNESTIRRRRKSIQSLFDEIAHHRAPSELMASTGSPVPLRCQSSRVFFRSVMEGLLRNCRSFQPPLVKPQHSVHLGGDSFVVGGDQGGRAFAPDEAE